MPQLCKICHHSNREEIDGLLLDGYPSLREIGMQFGVSKDSLFRHSQAHLDAPVATDETLVDDEPRQGEGIGDLTPVKETGIEAEPFDSFPRLKSNETINWEEILPPHQTRPRTAQEEETRRIWELLDRLPA